MRLMRVVVNLILACLSWVLLCGFGILFWLLFHETSGWMYFIAIPMAVVVGASYGLCITAMFWMFNAMWEVE